MNDLRRDLVRKWTKMRPGSKGSAQEKTGSGIKVADDGLDPAMVGQRYNAQLTATGGAGDYQWTIVEGAMPPGLTLDPLGTISGTPKSEGITRFTIQATDAKGKKSGKQGSSLTVSPKLKITSDLSRDPNVTKYNEDFIADLHAEGGSQPYEWVPVRGSEPPHGIVLELNGRIHGTAGPDIRGTKRFTVQCTDKNHYSDTADFLIKVGRQGKLWHRRRSGDDTKITRLSITVSSTLRSILFHRSNYLVLLAFGIPAFGAGWILAYAIATPGDILGYLAVGLLTAFAAFLLGGLGGFLFGIPKLVSSGELRQQRGLQYSPSSNLAEVSDWLTKLLLGAGLVQLTHLGAPIGRLIDFVAHGLYVLPASEQAAKVMAGAVLFGYVAIGLLDGYVMTTTWYQNWIIRHAGQS